MAEIILDETDRKITELLSKNGRMTFSELGENIGLSRVAAKNRVDSLIDKGVITGFEAKIDTSKTGRTVVFGTTIHCTGESFNGVIETVKNRPEILRLYKIGCSDRLFAICAAQDTEQQRLFRDYLYDEVMGVTKVDISDLIEIE